MIKKQARCLSFLSPLVHTMEDHGIAYCPKVLNKHVQCVAGT